MGIVVILLRVLVTVGAIALVIAFPWLLLIGPVIGLIVYLNIRREERIEREVERRMSARRD